MCGGVPRGANGRRGQAHSVAGVVVLEDPLSHGGTSVDLRGNGKIKALQWTRTAMAEVYPWTHVAIAATTVGRCTDF